MRSFLNLASWALPFVLAPFTILLLLSQTSVPGDILYPYKRGTEIMILATASLHPTTRVAFRTDLTNRRFNEAEILLLARRDTEGLSDFVEEVLATQEEADAISDPVAKEKLEQKINTSLEDYEKRLGAVKVQLIAQASAEPTIDSQPIVSPQAAIPTNTSVPLPTSPPGNPLLPTNTPVPLPTKARPTPTVVPPVVIARPTSVPTSSRVPTLVPTSPPTTPPSPPGPVDKVDDVEAWLKCLRTRPRNECPPPASIQSQQHETRRDRESRLEEERKEKEQKKLEREKRGMDDDKEREERERRN